MSDYAEIAKLGVATMHEAAGRIGVVDLDLTQVVPGSRVAGPARIAVCRTATTRWCMRRSLMPSRGRFSC